jgi:hypothetical protein
MVCSSRRLVESPPSTTVLPRSSSRAASTVKLTHPPGPAPQRGPHCAGHGQVQNDQGLGPVAPVWPDVLRFRQLAADWFHSCTLAPQTFTGDPPRLTPTPSHRLRRSGAWDAGVGAGVVAHLCFIHHGLAIMRSWAVPQWEGEVPNRLLKPMHVQPHALQAALVTGMVLSETTL